MFIYKITNKINGKMYIGADSAEQKRNLRWCEHRRLVRKSLRENITPSKYLYRAMTKYGIENFKYKVIDNNVETWDALMELEIFYIEKFNTFKGPGYNMTPGGDGVRLDEPWFSKLNEIEQEAYRERIAGIVTETWDNYSPEERVNRGQQVSLGIKRKVENMSDEEYEEYCCENYESLRKYKENASDADLKEAVVYMQEKWKEWYEKLGGIGRKEFKERQRQGRLNWRYGLTEDEKQNIRNQSSKCAKEWWKSMDEKLREEIGEKMSLKKRKKYTVVSPTGKKFNIDYLLKFCEENALNYRAMGMKSRGKRKALIDGWDCIAL